MGHVADDLNRIWYDTVRHRTYDYSPRFTEAGLCCGAGTVLIKAAGGTVHLAGAEARVMALLGAAYGETVPRDVLPHFDRAARAWNEGDETRALIHLAFARLPPLPDRAAVHRLFLAGGLLDAGFAPEALGLDVAITGTGDILWKQGYNPGQPRRPSGPGGGQWVRDGVAVGSATSAPSSSPPSSRHAGFLLAQAVENDPEARARERDNLLGEFLNPGAPYRIITMNALTREIRRLYPGGVNGGVLTAPNSTPSREDIEVMREALETRREEVVQRIANGHAFEKHVFKRGEFPGVTNRVEFANIVRSILRSPTSRVRDLERGRTGYYDPAENILVIVNPNDDDYGTMYKPKDGAVFFNEILKRMGPPPSTARNLDRDLEKRR